MLLGQKSAGQNSYQNLQDTLVFQKKKNNTKQFQLPLNEYEVVLKSKFGKKKKAIIIGFTENTLIARIYSFNKGLERQVKIDELNKIYADTTLKDEEIDSLSNLIVYSIQDTINISQVDKIKISNRNRKEMKRIVSIADWSAVGLLVVGIPAMAIFQSLASYLTWNVAAITVVIVGSLVESKTINLNKWEIVDRY
jgi:hypothetical protein